MVKGYVSGDIRVHGNRICKAGLMVGVSACSILLICTSPALAGGSGGDGGTSRASGTGGSGSDGTSSNSNGASGGGGIGPGGIDDTGVGGGVPGADGQDGSGSQGGGGGGGNVPGGDGPGDGGNGSSSSYGDGGNGGAVGANGTAGATTTGGSGGGGGGGGDGVYVTSDTILSSDVTGGNGGSGGGGGGATGAGGGGGGAGIVSDGGTLTINTGITVTGGAGGGGGSTGFYSGGGGGGGGAGIGSSGITITNNGTIRGGAGGNGGGGGSNFNYSGNGGDGGVGVIGSGITIINSGTIQSGAGGSGGRAVGSFNGDDGNDGNAITFTGGTNTLELRSGSSITGAVQANGASDTLTLGGSTDASFNASLIGDQYQGFETFSKTGTSSWTLTGTGSQNWTVGEGTLIGNVTSLQGNIVNNASVSFDQSTDGTYGGVVSGTGTLTKTGSGTLTLTGTNTHSGETTISGGALQVGDGGTTGSLSGNITNNASLIFNRSNDITYGGDVSGTGSLTKTGNGTLILTGTSSHSGGTTISGGTLQIGDGGTTGSLSGNITNNASLTFNRSNDITYAGVISSTGGLTKSGAGILTLTGTNTYTGATTVSGGTLAVNGSIAGSSTQVASGATLAGTGTVGQTTIASGGIHAPGNSIGTQTVSGNYALGSGAILLIEVDSSGNADQVIVNGTVDITGSKLRVTHITDTDFSGDASYDYVIISNDGTDAVTGDFTSIDNKLAFYDVTSTTTGGDGNDVTVELTRNSSAFEDHAASGNQSAVASVLNSLPGAGGETIRNAILGMSTGDAQHAYEQLSGDVHASSGAVNAQINGQASGQIGGRLAALRSGGTHAGTLVAGSTLSPAAMAGFASDGPMASDQTHRDSDAPMLALGDETLFQNGAAIWIQAIGGVGRIDGNDNIDATDYKWVGMIGGYDTTLSERTQVGVYFGYADGESRQSNRDATLGSGTLMAGLYGTRDLGDDWRVSGQAGWTRIAIDSHRNLDLGANDRTATADYIDHAVSADIELSRGFDLADQGLRNWRIEPYGGLGATLNLLGSFDETGAGSANLSREADSDLTGTASLGVRLAGMIKAGNGKTLIPQFRLGWDRYLGPTTSSTTLAFSGASSFTVSGSETDRDTLRGNLGFALADDDGWSLYADYQPSVSQNTREHAFGAGFRMKF